MIRALFFLFILAVSFSAYSQGENNSLKGIPAKERFFTGGGLGLGFGSGQDFISISPVVGYSLTRKLMAGTGITFRYTNYKYYKPSIKLTDYGINPFVRFTIYRGVFVQTEYEHLNYEFPITSVETTRQSFDSFLAGGGLVQPIGKNLAFYIMALYNFSYQDAVQGVYTPYYSPWIIRAGINIGGFLGI